MREAARAEAQPAEICPGASAWPAGGGEAGDLIRAFDWSRTTLGPINGWPQSLRAATDILLRSPIAIVLLWGEDGVMIYNDAYSVFAAGRHPRLLGSKVREGWPEIAEFNDNVMRVGLAGGTLAYKDQEQTLYRDGVAGQVWMDLGFSPVPGESGRPAGVIAVVIETTERVRAERRHREAEAALRDLHADLERQVVERSREGGRTWQVSPDILGVINADGFFESSNPAWGSVLGWSETEVSRTPFFDFIHPDDLDRTYLAWENAKKGQPALRFENRYRRKGGGYRWLSWVAVPEGGKIYCSARDITVEKEQAAELAAAQDALRQSQKMEAVGQLTGGIAHDFNNMLAIVIGSLDLLGRWLGTADPRARRYVDAAYEGARRAAALTQRLLAFSRQQPLKPEPIDVNALVAGMSDLLRQSVGGAIRLETALADGLWSTHADPNQLENVILNLAVNARDAMPGGGKLRIETANAALDAPDPAALPDLAAGDYVRIAVTDTGCGMRADVIGRAFDPFFTTKEVGKGTGLGLSQVYGFVKQSGGHVTINSEPGRGTTVEAYLPRFSAAQDAVDGVAYAGVPPDGARDEPPPQLARGGDQPG